MVLHSSAAVHLPCPAQRSFLDRLRSHDQPRLWDTFECDGDGEWIYMGILRKSPTMVSDRSYNKKLADDVSSGAFVIRCEATGNVAKGA